MPNTDWDDGGLDAVIDRVDAEQRLARHLRMLRRIETAEVDQTAHLRKTPAGRARLDLMRRTRRVIDDA